MIVVKPDEFGDQNAYYRHALVQADVTPQGQVVLTAGDTIGFGPYGRRAQRSDVKTSQPGRFFPEYVQFRSDTHLFFQVLPAVPPTAAR